MFSTLPSITCSWLWNLGCESKHSKSRALACSHIFWAPLSTPMTSSTLEFLHYLAWQGERSELLEGKAKLMEELLRTAFQPGNSLLTSWALRLNSCSPGFVSNCAQVLREQWIRKTATCKKVSQHSFHCSDLHNIFHLILCYPLYPVGGSASGILQSGLITDK